MVFLVVPALLTSHLAILWSGQGGCSQLWWHHRQQPAVYSADVICPYNLASCLIPGWWLAATRVVIIMSLLWRVLATPANHGSGGPRPGHAGGLGPVLEHPGNPRSGGGGRHQTGKQISTYLHIYYLHIYTRARLPATASMHTSLHFTHFVIAFWKNEAI